MNTTESPLRTVMWHLGVATVIVAPLSMGLGGRLELAWGLGWSLAAILVWTTMRFPHAWLIGLSAGGAVGVGSLGLVRPSVLSVFLTVIVWGVMGGIVWRMQRAAESAYLTTTLGKTIIGGLLVGLFGSLLAAFIGNLLLQVELKVAGALIGSFFLGPCWTMGTVGGVILGTLANRRKRARR
jgi:hypothetical protein